MHIETLDAVHRESKRLPPIQKVTNSYFYVPLDNGLAERRQATPTTPSSPSLPTARARAVTAGTSAHRWQRRVKPRPRTARMPIDPPPPSHPSHVARFECLHREGCRSCHPSGTFCSFTESGSKCRRYHYQLMELIERQLSVRTIEWLQRLSMSVIYRDIF